VRIALTCVGGRLSFDTVRALRSASDFECWLLGIDGNPEAEPRVLCDAFRSLPSAATDPDGFAAAALKTCEEFGIALLIVCSDEEVKAVHPLHDRFSAVGTILSCGRESPVDTVMDKLALYEALRAADIQTLEFCAVSSAAELYGAAARMGYPARKLVLKPRTGRGSRGVILLDPAATGFSNLVPNRFCGFCSLDEAEHVFAENGQSFADYLLMEFIEGDTYDVDVVAEGGKALEIVSRLRQLRNVFWPTSTGHKILRDPTAQHAVAEACRVLGMDGSADFDVIMRGFDPILLDAACRFSGSVGASMPAGINIPAQLVRSRLGMSFSPQAATARDGVVVRPFLTMAEIPAANETDLL
jgi:predicted ATP-grasp superfamily ATP-dependent carboligase